MYVIQYTESYKELASVACDSLKRFSKHPYIKVRLSLPDTFPIVYEQWNKWQYARLNWLYDNLRELKHPICLLDADIIATPSIDKVWDYCFDYIFPIHMEHPHNPDSNHLSMVRVKRNVTYRYVTPSFWFPHHYWFSNLCLNIMADKHIDENSAINVALWSSGVNGGLFPYMFVQHDAGKDFNDGVMYHGIKDVELARSILNGI